MVLFRSPEKVAKTPRARMMRQYDLVERVTLPPEIRGALDEVSAPPTGYPES